MSGYIIVLLVSTFTKGEQMVPVLNQLGVHCSVYGNHDFGESLPLILGCVSGKTGNFPGFWER